MSEDDQPDRQPARQFWLDRASARTPDEREEHFQSWWLKYGQPYQAAVATNGGTPLTTDIEQARDLFFRRYRKSA